jgi:hypothetical protein
MYFCDGWLGWFGGAFLLGSSVDYTKKLFESSLINFGNFKEQDWERPFQSF